MRTLITITIILCSVLSSFAQADRVLGLWLTEDKDGKVEIYKQGDKYFGKLIWGKRMFEADGKTSKKDVHNPDVKLRSRNMQNLIFLTDFKYADGIWEDGKVYDPESGKTYSANMKIVDGNLELRGYIGISLLGKSTTWTRIK